MQGREKLLETLFAYVDEHFEEMYQDLEQICSFQSVEGRTEELEKARDFLTRKLEQLGTAYKKCPVEGGNSVLYGEKAGKDPRYVLFYNHYDVVDAGDKTAWRTKDPYQLETQGDLMYARGISDDKGSLLTRVHAVQTILNVMGELPVGVKFFWEGDEETCSPSLFRFTKEHPEEFRQMADADVCLWENGRVDEQGHPWARFGIRGSCCFDLKLKTAKAPVHTRLGAVVPNAAFRMASAIASLKDAKERIAIKGFYDDVQEQTEEDKKVLEAFPYDGDGQKKSLGIDRYLLDVQGDQVKQRIYMEPAFSVCGIESGFAPNGFRGVIPNEARAMISFELVADQDPERIEKLLREHMKEHGFGDMEIHSRGWNCPVKTPLDIPFRKKLEESAKEAFGQELVIEPLQLGPGPAIVFRRAWPELPIVGIGPGNNGSNHHGIDENLRVEDYKKAVKHCIALLYTYGEGE